MSLLPTESNSWKNAIIRSVVAFFLFLLVLTLVITFIPGEAEQNFLDTITGQASTNAGKIGSETISVDYLMAAKRNCYERYKQYNPNFSDEGDLLNSCAFSATRDLFALRMIAKELGFQSSEDAIKRDLSNQAKTIHSQSDNQPGYTKEESRSVEDIYRILLFSSPMQYKLDSTSAQNLIKTFLYDKPTRDLTEAEIKERAQASSMGLKGRFVSYSEADYISNLDKSIVITEDEVKQLYDKEVKEGNLTKEADGSLPSFEKRKQILQGRARLEKKKKIMDESNSKISEAKAKGILEISKLVGSPIENLKPASLSDLLADRNFSSISNDPSFFKSLADAKPGTVLGPFQSESKTIFLEFEQIVPITSGSKAPELSTRNELAGFLQEAVKVFSEPLGIERSKGYSTADAN